MRRKSKKARGNANNYQIYQSYKSSPDTLAAVCLLRYPGCRPIPKVNVFPIRLAPLYPDVSGSTACASTNGIRLDYYRPI